MLSLSENPAQSYSSTSGTKRVNSAKKPKFPQSSSPLHFSNISCSLRTGCGGCRDRGKTLNRTRRPIRESFDLGDSNGLHEVVVSLLKDLKVIERDG